MAESLTGDLTPRQRQVIGLIAAGMTQAEIARDLNITPRTVQHHVDDACARLGARNACHAICLLLTSNIPQYG